MDTTLSQEQLYVLAAPKAGAVSQAFLSSPGPHRHASGCCALSTLRDLWAQLRLAHVTIDLLQHVTAAPHIATCPLPSPTPTASVCHRRTVGKSTGLSCPFTGSCKVNKAQRQHCLACRLQKCLDGGMKKESESAPSPPPPLRVQAGPAPSLSHTAGRASRHCAGNPSHTAWRRPQMHLTVLGSSALQRPFPRQALFPRHLACFFSRLSSAVPVT